MPSWWENICQSSFLCFRLLLDVWAHLLFVRSQTFFTTLHWMLTNIMKPSEYSVSIRWFSLSCTHVSSGLFLTELCPFFFCRCSHRYLLFSYPFHVLFFNPHLCIVLWCQLPLSFLPTLFFSLNNMSLGPALHQRPSETLTDLRLVFSETAEPLSALAGTDGDAALIWFHPSHN